ncbi:DUF3888 domain-containing protein [Bacillus salitolerans]|uniref:DUF3888 domain-containing protein n=1 Tax=Bacillus salitolerans TaxID=1437434 RepID=A0ABW4LNG7_9BACI
MNKSLLGVFIILLLFHAQPKDIKAGVNEPDYNLVYDSLLTTLEPYIEEAVISYYGERKQYGLYDAKIIEIIRESEGGYSFVITVQVNTFEHAHGPPHGKESITFNVSPFGVKAIDYKHEGDHWERKVEDFYQKSITDIKKTFDLNIKSFKVYSYGQLLFQSEKKKSFQSLSEIVIDIVEDILNPEIKPPYKNVIDPVTFIKDDYGYILYKKADGMNVVLTLKKEKQNWIVIDKQYKKGKKMPKELLWYM